MALYGGKRDIMLFNSLNKELLSKIIEQKVGYYKIDLKTTETNIYEESLHKKYYNPVLINCLITRGDQSTTSDEFGPDKKQINKFAFFRENLKEQDIFPEDGDVILWNNNYYEVENLIENQLIVGKTPEYSYSPNVDRFGSSLSIILETKQIRPDKLGIQNIR